MPQTDINALDHSDVMHDPRMVTFMANGAIVSEKNTLIVTMIDCHVCGPKFQEMSPIGVTTTFQVNALREDSDIEPYQFTAVGAPAQAYLYALQRVDSDERDFLQEIA